MAKGEQATRAPAVGTNAASLRHGTGSSAEGRA